MQGEELDGYSSDVSSDSLNSEDSLNNLLIEKENTSIFSLVWNFLNDFSEYCLDHHIIF